MLEPMETWAGTQATLKAGAEVMLPRVKTTPEILKPANKLKGAEALAEPGTTMAVQ
jgi:hypothetical protein